MTTGYCDPAFAAVRDIFADTFARGEELGAAVTVFVGGRRVVDLWAGIADERTGRVWAADTACVTFSATKAVTSAAALLLVEQGRLDLGARVSEYWPEFAAHGKAATTVEHLLTHRAGLAAFDRPVTAEEAADPVAMAALLAGQSPDPPPGAAHGYHAITFGWLIGEVIRRVSGRTVGEFVRDEVGADLRFGVPQEEIPQLARIEAGRALKAADRPADEGAVARLVAATQDPSSLFVRSTGNPAASFNKAVVLTAGWPAAGLICTARALADFYRRLLDGTLVSPGLLRDAVTERVRGPDRTLVLESAFGLGFMRPSANMWLPPVARSSAFGHPGASGALGLGDSEAGVAFAYVPNLTHPALGDRRAYRLVEATYAALG